jgi:hypothetical protein
LTIDCHPAIGVKGVGQRLNLDEETNAQHRLFRRYNDGVRSVSCIMTKVTAPIHPIDPRS